MALNLADTVLHVHQGLISHATDHPSCGVMQSASRGLLYAGC